MWPCACCICTYETTTSHLAIRYSLEIGECPTVALLQGHRAKKTEHLSARVRDREPKLQASCELSKESCENVSSVLSSCMEASGDSHGKGEESRRRARMDSLDECDGLDESPSRVAGMRGAAYLGVDLGRRMLRHDNKRKKKKFNRVLGQRARGRNGTQAVQGSLHQSTTKRGLWGGGSLLYQESKRGGHVKWEGDT